MKTRVHKSLNLCGYDVGKPLRVTTNKLGKIYTEPVGWAARQASWLTIPQTKNGYIGDEVIYQAAP